MKKRKGDTSVPFQKVSTRLEPLHFELPELSSAFSELPAADLLLVQELKSKEAELMSWLAADPRRAELLQTDPETAIKDLLLHLRMDERELKEIPMPDGWTIDFLQVRKAEAGAAGGGPSDLLKAVWTYLNATEQNLAAFMADPIAVVDAVAASSNASVQQRNTVVTALSTVLGIQPVLLRDYGQMLRDEQLLNQLSSSHGLVYLRRT